MHLPPLPVPVISDYYVSGDVTIAGDVAMASGVILRATPGYRIVLGEGVCVGLGCILHACEGDIIVRAGAILGAGVLLMGWAEVGRRACLGSAVTLFRGRVDAGQVIMPGALLGETGSSGMQKPPDSWDPPPYPSPNSTIPKSTPPPIEEPQRVSEPPQFNLEGGFFSPHQAPTPADPDRDLDGHGLGSPPSSVATLPEPVVSPPPQEPKVSDGIPQSSPPHTPTPDQVLEVPQETIVLEDEPGATPASPQPPVQSAADTPPAQTSAPDRPQPLHKPAVVYGKDYFLQMRMAMFPQGES